MKVKYNMDIIKRYAAGSHTPGFENRQLPFYISFCGHYLAGGSYFTEREDMGSYLLIYTVNGSGIIKHRGKKFNIQKGQVILFDCRQYQYYATNPQDVWEFKWVHFNGTACESYFRLINNDSFSLVQLGEEGQFNEVLNGLFNLIMSDDINKDVKCSMLMTSLLTEMVINCRRLNNSRYPKHNSIINSAIDFIHENYTNPITIEDILKHVHLSRFHFVRTFKRFTGRSPYEYLNNYRINASKALLMETNMPINEIALKVGFCHVNNFIREFKVITGLTPKKFKNSMV